MEVFDKSDLLDRLGDDEDLCKEIIELFIEDTPHQINKLKKALEKKDASIIQRQAHLLKGSSANTSVLGMQEIAFQIEKAGETGDLEIATSLLLKLEEEFEKFKRIISNSGILIEEDIRWRNNDKNLLFESESAKN